MEKTCAKCKKRYPSGRYFYRDIQKGDGLTSWCKECIRRERIEYYEVNSSKVLEYAKKNYSLNRIKRIKRAYELRKQRVSEIFELLGNKCSKCGFNNKIALQIDHINGGGYKHRKISGGGMTYYNQIKKGIKKYRLLCANCNFIEGVRKGYRKSIWN